MTKSSSKPPQLRDEVEALRARVEELEASRPGSLEPTDDGKEQKKAPYELSIWENFLIIVVAILIVKLLANWLFGPA